LVTEDDPAAECKHIRQLVRARAAGVIIVPTQTVLPETATLLDLLPMVQIIGESEQIRSDFFFIDEAQGVLEATTHLLSLATVTWPTSARPKN